jgi:hypothetical protein
MADNMDTGEIIAGLVLLLCVAGVAYYLLQHRPQRAVANARRSDVERDFARVFSMTSAQGKSRLIRRWMDRTGCDRTEAMRLATEEWRRDNRSSACDLETAASRLRFPRVAAVTNRFRTAARPADLPDGQISRHFPVQPYLKKYFA